MSKNPFQGSSSLSQLIDNYKRLSQEGTPLVLATVIETMGSTYRKAGARMLIAANRQFFGLIGGGCFEGDLFDQASKIFESGEPTVVFYDMRAPEDAVWGLGLGCNGAVRILLQRLAMDGKDATILSLERLVRTNQTQCLITPYSGEHAGVSYTPDDLPKNATGQIIQDYITKNQPKRPSLIELNNNAAAFIDVIPARHHLLIIGAGADAVPVNQLATQLDWRVTIIDYRPKNIVAERFPGSESVCLVPPPELISTFKEDPIDAVVLMTHNIDHDAQYLPRLAELPLSYLGLLGPKDRADQLFERSGVDPTVFGDKARAPVGLDLGGRSPESIALSMIAEIQACLNGRDAAILSQKSLEARRNSL